MAPRVELPKYLADEFRVAAKAAFPREEYAIILGSATKGGVYRPSFLYFPSDRAKFSGKEWVQPQDHWWFEARKAARDQKVSILGDIHSHPFSKDVPQEVTGIPSAPDWDSSAYLIKKTRRKNPIMGICCLYETGRGLDSVIRFWLAVDQPSLCIIEN